jgi:N-acetylmuramoyl-L-alanine amidase
VVIDPGHQLGNHHYLGQISLVPAAGSASRATTGTATDSGFPRPMLAVSFDLVTGWRWGRPSS